MENKIRSYQHPWVTIEFVLFACFMVSFFLPTRINGFIAMLLMIFAGIKWIAKQLHFKGYGGIVFLPLIFLCLLIGQLYSTDLAQGWTIIERNIALLLLPIATYGCVRFSENQMIWLFRIFAGSAILASFICLGIAGFHSYEAGSIFTIPNNTHFLYNRFMHHQLTDTIGMHAVYFACWMAFINLVLFYNLLMTKRKLIIQIGFIGLFLYGCFLLFLFKSASIAGGFVLGIFILFIGHFGKNLIKSPGRMIGFGILLLAAIFFGFTIVQSKLEHFSLAYDMQDQQLSALGIRLSIWDCTWQAIQQHWFLGAGTGDAQHALVESYQQNKFAIGLRDDFNSHNMFLQYWLSNGIYTLLVWIAGLVILVRKSFKVKNLPFFFFLLLFILFSLTESTLRTQKGLFFFVFFASLFYYRPDFLKFKSPTE